MYCGTPLTRMLTALAAQASDAASMATRTSAVAQKVLLFMGSPSLFLCCGGQGGEDDLALSADFSLSRVDAGQAPCHPRLVVGVLRRQCQGKGGRPQPHRPRCGCAAYGHGGDRGRRRVVGYV